MKKMRAAKSEMDDSTDDFSCIRIGKQITEAVM